MLHSLSETPYYAVIFTSIKNSDLEGYNAMSERMLQLAAEQDGFLGVESAQSEIGITVSYWKDLASIKKWKANQEHMEAQRMGHRRWYSSYAVRIALVERHYEF